MPRPVSIFYHPDCLLHDTGPGHPERPERLSAIRQSLLEAPFAPLLHWHEPEPVPAEWIERIHTPEYRQYIEEACLKGQPFADFGETVICPDSYRAALLSAGGAIGIVDAVFRDGYSAAFNLTRPPGHHSSAEKAMGFCLFNNAAIAARYAEETYGIERICIFDWDVHHGNGTQDIFHGSPSVLFVSLHQLPLYPHTGEYYETGSGAGKGLTLNCPLPPDSGIDQYLEVMEEEVLPAISAFAPQLFIISAGFDAHRLDPLAQIRLEAHHYHVLTRWILQRAADSAMGRVVSLLEGGYHLQAIAESASEHLRALTEGLPAALSGQ